MMELRIEMPNIQNHNTGESGNQSSFGSYQPGMVYLSNRLFEPAYLIFEKRYSKTTRIHKSGLGPVTTSIIHYDAWCVRD
jgi:hypothetical protein